MAQLVVRTSAQQGQEQQVEAVPLSKPSAALDSIRTQHRAPATSAQDGPYKSAQDDLSLLPQFDDLHDLLLILQRLLLVSLSKDINKVPCQCRTHCVFVRGFILDAVEQDCKLAIREREAQG